MVDVPGTPVTFGGGFAQASRQSRALDIDAERNEILREELEQDALKERVARIRSAVSDMNSANKDMFSLFTQDGGERLARNPTTVAAFEQTLESIEEGLAQAGADPQTLQAARDRATFQRQILAQLSSDDPVAVQDAREKAQAILQIGQETGSPGLGRVAAGLPAGTARPLLFVHKSSGQQIAVDPLDQKAQEDLINSGFVPVPGGVAVQAGSLSEIGTPLTPSQVGEQAQEGTRAALNITQLSSILGKLRNFGPGVTGIRGAVGEAAGGVLGQLNQTLGSITSEAITGVSEEELESFRVESRAALARSITQFTGEESGRFTEQERALTDQALRLLKPEANFAQIKSATEIAMKLSFLSRDRNLFLQGLPFAFDLRSDEGIGKQARQLLEFGLSESAVRETINDQIRLRSLLEEQRQSQREQDELEKARTR